jgi:transglutaminase-like putative cysteine protease
VRARWIAACVGVAGTACAAALTALAQGPESVAPAPVLHEDLSPPAADDRRRSRRTPPEGPALLGEDPAAGQNPTAIRDDGKILPEPEAGGSPAAEEPVHGRGGFGADRRTESIPDNQTSGDDALRYVEVFNPSVVPFKRMSALDAVRDDYTLGIGDPSLRELRVTGKPSPTFDRFWASMLIELKPGEDVPIPSVAPEMRIVSYEVEPRTQLTFSVDGADNFYVRSDEPGSQGVHRLVFLAEADPRYFAPQMPRGLRVTDIPASRVRPVPNRIAQLAQQAHRRLNLRREMALDDALARLVAYFRGFEPKELKSPTGNIYWDLVTQQAGVCRHRAFAFMVTANALGIPTRFVSNEAHAWVEVWTPNGRSGREGRWIRIDLGGAALSLEVENASGKTMYRPRGEDPFPQPPPYSENYTRLEGDISGLSPSQIAEAQTPRARPNGRTGSGGGASVDGAGGEDDPVMEGDPESSEPLEEAGEDEPLPAPGEGLPAMDEAQLRGKQPTAVRVTSASATAFRGETVAIEGVVTGAADAGLPDQHVVLYLAPAGGGGASAQIVGHTMSGPDGRFRVEVLVPFEVELREHEVFASTPGDDKQQPAVSR